MGALGSAVRDLGGEISVESERNHGTSLSMTFPMETMVVESAPTVVVDSVRRSG
jgi:chemotaxis protein histidine kinase CheA